MECDWEVEIGEGAPVIDAAWAGHVDLRAAPQRAGELAEARAFAAMAAALRKLNQRSSPVWTSKCDFWPELNAEEFDADELDAATGCAHFAAGCYFDLLPCVQHPLHPDQIISILCVPWCARLRCVPLRACRVDFVVRRAIMPGPQATQTTAPDSAGAEACLGITVYVTACGATLADAHMTLGSALDAVSDAVVTASTLQ